MNNIDIIKGENSKNKIPNKIVDNSVRINAAWCIFEAL